MQLRYLFLFIFFFSQQLGMTQSVWAGDVNNNGIVNKIDLLYLGYAFGETGPARVDTNSIWIPMALPTAWEGNFPNGVNFLFADCNGDGIVNELDAGVIRQNAGLIHDDIPVVPEEILIGAEGVNPACQFNNPPTAIPVDQVFKLDINLGDMGIPVENLSGLTFTIDIAPDIIGMNNLQLTFKEDAWIEPDSSQAIQLQQIDEERARLKVALAKTGRVPVNGSGTIAEASFIVIGDLVDFLMVDSVTFMLDSITVLDNELNPIPIVPDTIKLAIDKNLSVNTFDVVEKSSIDVYPNPNKGMVLLEANGNVLQKVELFNQLGQLVFMQELAATEFQSIDFQHLRSGAYYLKIYAKEAIITTLLYKN